MLGFWDQGLVFRDISPLSADSNGQEPGKSHANEGCTGVI